MKLRNKKTGEIKTLQQVIHEYYAKHELDSLAKLNAEWEDYEEKEPLIEYEDIRKIVRAWADTNCFKNIKVRTFIGGTRFSFGIFYIEFAGIFIHLDEDKTYTITELCGEKE